MTSEEFSIGKCGDEHAVLTATRQRLSFWKCCLNPKNKASVPQKTHFGRLSSYYLC